MRFKAGVRREQVEASQSCPAVCPFKITSNGFLDQLEVCSVSSQSAAAPLVQPTQRPHRVSFFFSSFFFIPPLSGLRLRKAKSTKARTEVLTGICISMITTFTAKRWEFCAAAHVYPTNSAHFSSPSLQRCLHPPVIFLLLLWRCHSRSVLFPTNF